MEVVVQHRVERIGGSEYVRAWNGDSLPRLAANGFEYHDREVQAMLEEATRLGVRTQIVNRDGDPPTFVHPHFDGPDDINADVAQRVNRKLG